MKSPKVSVIISTYNRANFVGKAIKSVLAQSFMDFEVLVIDDSTNGDTEKIVKGFSDRRLRYIHPKERLGVCGAMNYGLELAEGEYIAVLDDDDHWIAENKLKRQVDFLDTHSDYVLVGTNIIMANGNGIEIGRKKYPLTDEEIRSKILMQNCFAHSSVMYRAEVVRKLGGYSPIFISYCPSGLNDYDLWLKLGSIGKFANLPIYGVCYLLAQKGKVWESALEELGLISKYRHQYPNYWKAIWVRCVQYPIKYIGGQLIKEYFYKPLREKGEL